MEEATYCMAPNYIHRESPAYCNQRSATDEWQKEVYAEARRLADDFHLDNIVDVGTGSGWKLLENFGDKRTIGLDIGDNYEWLRKFYRGREWGLCDFVTDLPFKPDLIIAADVIEHLPDPDVLLDFIKRHNPRFAVISTPARDMIPYERDGRGPPRNPCHVREWTRDEFWEYLTIRGFTIRNHFISNADQWTQVAIVEAP